MSMLQLNQMAEWYRNQAGQSDATKVAYMSAIGAGIVCEPRLYWMLAKGLTVTFPRFDALPEAQVRAINEVPAELCPSPVPVSAALKILNYTFSYDYKALNASGDPVRELANQRALAAVSLRRTFNKYFFNGDSSLYPAQFDGLKRIAEMEGSTVSIADNGGTLTLEKLDEAVDLAQQCADGENGRMLIAMNSQTLRQLNNLLLNKSAMNLQWEKSGQIVASYAGIPIMVVRGDAANNAILGFTETQGESSASASAYVITFARDESEPGLFAAYDGPPEETIIPHQIGQKVSVDWAVALLASHKNAVVRLKGITLS